VSLTPWFLIEGRPYPVFLYIYAIWHYHANGKKSLKQSAVAAGKLFGVESFNKSTVSRSIKAMAHFIDATNIDRPLADNNSGFPCHDEIIEQVPKMLNDRKLVESLEEMHPELIANLPDPVRDTATADNIFSAIPAKLSRIIKCQEPAGRKSRDIRKRAARPRAKKPKRVQRHFVFAEHRQLEETRIAFIEICCGLVLDAASTYHRFLI
jgi:hypothetical protein